MPRGTPDGGYLPYQFANNSPDTGQTADRLLMGGGSISKSGRIIWATGFENGLMTDFSFAGPNTNVVLAPFFGLSAWQGNYMLALQTQAVLSDFSSINKYFPGSLQTGNWGVEVMAGIEGFNVNFEIIFANSVVSGIVGAPLTQSARVRLAVGATNASLIWSVRNNAGVFVQFANVSNIMAINTNAYYNIKWVPDFAHDTNGKFFINNVKYDLSASGPMHTGFGADEKSNVGFQLVNVDANSHIALLDNMIVTSDEP